jgi:hypothetical protein
MRYLKTTLLYILLVTFMTGVKSNVVVENVKGRKGLVIVKVLERIQPDEEIKFKEELEKIKKRGFKIKLNAIVFDTAGGNSFAAKEIGKIIRERKMNTYVAPNAKCGSACIYAVSGGLIRMIYGKVSVHRTSFNDDYPTEKLEKALSFVDRETRKHIEEMGLSSLLTDAILTTPNWASRELDETEKRRWGINATDRYYEELRFRTIATMHKISVDDVSEIFRANYENCEKQAKNFESTIWDCVQEIIK